jgi:hypothetical protein
MKRAKLSNSPPPPPREGDSAKCYPKWWYFPRGFSPEGNIITEGNISPNPPSGGSINDILYRKLKASKLRIKNLTHTYVNTMFYFRINASICHFSFESQYHISFGILMTTFFKICFKILKKPQVLRLKFDYSSLIYHYLCFIGEHGVEHCQKERRLVNWWRKAWYRD